jgi:hypothetical protein
MDGLFGIPERWRATYLLCEDLGLVMLAVLREYLMGEGEDPE